MRYMWGGWGGGEVSGGGREGVCVGCNWRRECGAGGSMRGGSKRGF